MNISRAVTMKTMQHKACGVGSMVAIQTHRSPGAQIATDVGVAWFDLLFVHHNRLYDTVSTNALADHLCLPAAKEIRWLS